MDDFKFNVGDKVKVINCGNAYTTYENWFKEQELGSYYTTRYAYGINPKVINNSNTVYKVIKRGTHNCGDDNLYLIQRDCYEQPMFLIGEEGLKAVKDKVLVKNELCNDLRNYCKEILIENDIEDTIGEVESEILAIAEKLADCICD